MLIVLELPLKDIAAVGGVDLLDGQLLGVLNGLTVDGGAAGQGASVVAAVEVEAASEEDAVSVDAEEPQAARLRTMEAASTELTSFFIIVFPPRNKATAHNRFAQPRAASLTKL